MKNTRARLSRPVTFCLGLGLLFVFASEYSHQRNFKNETPVSRQDLLHALMAGTVQLDAYEQNTICKAAYGGHYYSDKAPGAAFMALPSFAAAAWVLPLAGISLESDKGWLISDWVACAGSNGIIAAAGCAAMFAWLCRWVSPASALITTVALFLGAAPLPYATIMYSHALVIGSLTIALWAIEQRGGGVIERPPSNGFAKDGDLPRARDWVRGNPLDLLAGGCCGMALASEFTAGIAVAGIFVWLISSQWRRTLAFCLAAIPPLLLIPIYSWLCFGRPFTLPYSLNASIPELKEGLCSITMPNAGTAYDLLFSPTRGLFFWSPFLVMAAVGYWTLMKTDLRLFWLTYAVPVIQVVVISGRTWDWQAGPTLGPRLLSPMLPFLALPCALGVCRFPKFGLGLAAYSLLITSLATLTDACPGSDTYNPLLELQIPLFLHRDFSPNIGMAIGLTPYASILLYYAIMIGGIGWLWRRLDRPSSHDGSDVSGRAPALDIDLQGKPDTGACTKTRDVGSVMPALGANSWSRLNEDNSLIFVRLWTNVPP